MANERNYIRYCYRCGSEISSDAVFCHKCGYKMNLPQIEKELLDCRQTKNAIYLTKEQAIRGGIVNYCFEETRKTVVIDIEPGILSGTEKKAAIEYIGETGYPVKIIRKIKVYVDVDPNRTNNRYTVPSNTRATGTKKESLNKKLLLGILAVICVAAVVSALSRESSQLSPLPSSEAVQTTQAPVAKPSEPASSVKSDLSSVIPHYETRFYLKNIDPSLQEDVKALYIGIKEFKSTINLPKWTTTDNADLLVSIIHLDCPELFQVSDSGEYTITTTNGMASAISLPYSMTKAQYDERLDECNKLIRGLARTVSGRNEERKEEYVYQYLTDRVSYNTTKDQCGNAYGALINNAAKCDGISLAAKWIFEEMGIPALVITGQEQGDPYGHAWNCVYINGAYYDLDLTNDLKTSNRAMKLYSAYNVKRSWLSDIYPISPEIKSHYRLPDSSSMSDSYHVQNGSYIYGGSNIRSQFYDLLDETAEYYDFGYIQFERDSDYQTFMSNYESYVESWFNANGYGGGFKLNTISELRTVGFELDFDY